jgi:intracellular sulfur oxidation DsrE/DsrF family protein
MKAAKHLTSLITMLLLTVVFSTGAYSGEMNDADALAGANQGKIIFDVNLTDAKKMVLYLSVIKQTNEDLEKQNIKPDIVVAFRGLAVTLIQKDPKGQSAEQQEVSKQIGQLIAKLQSMGMRMEACSVATGLFKVSNDSLWPGIKVVGNTFISLMGYQQMGYAIIPIM